MYSFKKQAFTLVELIVVITILAILGTISFISLLGFQKTAREAARISDLNTIAKALDFFYTQESYYPTPTDPFEITFSGSLAWNQGTFGIDTQKVAKRISEVPVDPLTKNEYAYSTTNTRQEYELGAISESLLTQTNPNLLFPNQANATNNYYTNIKGNYNKQIVTVKEPSRIYILGVPTIITSEITDVTIQDIIANGSFALRNSQNLPGSYDSNLPDGQTIDDPSSSFSGGTLIDTTTPVIYDGSIELLSDDSEKQKFADNLVSYYQGSNLTESNIPGLDTLLDTNTSTPSNALSYVNTLIKTDFGGLPSKNIKVNPVTSPEEGGEGGGEGGEGDGGQLDKFIMVWKTDNDGETDPNQIRLPLFDGGNYNFTVDWENDGIIDDTITSWNQAEVTHTYDSPGIYIVILDGQIDGISFSQFGATLSYEQQQYASLFDGIIPQSHAMFAIEYEAAKLIDITQWGTAVIGNGGSQFEGVGFTDISAVDSPDLSYVTDASYMFAESTLTSGLDSWDVSGFTNMNSIFSNSSFDEDISGWYVLNVSNYQYFDDSTPASWIAGEKPCFGGSDDDGDGAMSCWDADDSNDLIQ